VKDAIDKTTSAWSGSDYDIPANHGGQAAVAEVISDSGTLAVVTAAGQTRTWTVTRGMVRCAIIQVLEATDVNLRLYFAEDGIEAE
jgi:hypothetical protein